MGGTADTFVFTQLLPFKSYTSESTEYFIIGTGVDISNYEGLLKFQYLGAATAGEYQPLGQLHLHPRCALAYPL